MHDFRLRDPDEPLISPEPRVRRDYADQDAPKVGFVIGDEDVRRDAKEHRMAPHIIDRCLSLLRQTCSLWTSHSGTEAANSCRNACQNEIHTPIALSGADPSTKTLSHSRAGAAEIARSCNIAWLWSEFAARMQC